MGPAARLGVDSHVSINFLPNAVYEAATCIRATLEAVRRCQFPAECLIFEITENEKVVDKEHLKRIIREYRRQGFKTAIDDFGAGYAGRNLLAEYRSLRSFGLYYFQGYMFARPAFEGLPQVHWPAEDADAPAAVAS